VEGDSGVVYTLLTQLYSLQCYSTSTYSTPQCVLSPVPMYTGYSLTTAAGRCGAQLITTLAIDSDCHAAQNCWRVDKRYRKRNNYKRRRREEEEEEEEEQYHHVCSCCANCDYKGSWSTHPLDGSLSVCLPSLTRRAVFIPHRYTSLYACVLFSSVLLADLPSWSLAT
jgi:hypothetical protein